MLYCLDTNIVVDILRGNKELLLKLEGAQQKNDFCITFLSLAELFKGAYLVEKSQEAVNLIEDFMRNIILINFNKEACKIYGEKFAELKNKGKQTQEIDLFIGSISLAHDSILITKNKKHFENISGLKIIEW